MPRAEPLPFENMQQLSDFLGGYSLRRVPLDPRLGRSTVKNLCGWQRRYDVRFELVHGVVVENPFGPTRTLVGTALRQAVRDHADRHGSGVTAAADARVVLGPDTAYGPDVAFLGTDRLPPARRLPVGSITPDLIACVHTRRNTRQEMQFKRTDYFLAGVRLVWEIDPRTRTATAYTGPAVRTVIPAAGALDGGDVLPGFRLPLAKLFDKLERPAGKKPPRKRGK